MEEICGVYTITSISEPDKEYVGSTKNLKMRKKAHRVLFLSGKHHSDRLKEHCAKYGRDDLVFMLIESCDPSMLKEREQWYIDILKPWFNRSQYASVIGSTVTEYTRKKMSISNKLKPRPSEETKRKISASLMGHPYTPPKNKRVLTEEEKAHISKMLTGKKQSDATKKKRSESCKAASLYNKGCFKSGMTPQNTGKIRYLGEWVLRESLSLELQTQIRASNRHRCLIRYALKCARNKLAKQ